MTYFIKCTISITIIIQGELMSNTKETLKQLIRESLIELYKHDSSLIEHEHIKKGDKNYVSERAIVFRFAHYMQNLINEKEIYSDLRQFHLDCEYNRNLNDVKGLENNCIPDVIIHKRGETKSNICVIECKTHWNTDNDNDDSDIDKLKKFTSSDYDYKYKFGFFLKFLENSSEITIFENTQEIGTYTEENLVVHLQ